MGVMASMKRMGGMMGKGIMGSQQPGTASPAIPQAAPASPEDHTAHHSAP
jgi:hypothetical protein